MTDEARERLVEQMAIQIAGETGHPYHVLAEDKRDWQALRGKRGDIDIPTTYRRDMRYAAKAALRVLAASEDARLLMTQVYMTWPHEPYADELEHCAPDIREHALGSMRAALAALVPR